MSASTSAAMKPMVNTLAHSCTTLALMNYNAVLMTQTATFAEVLNGTKKICVYQSHSIMMIAVSMVSTTVISKRNVLLKINAVTIPRSHAHPSTNVSPTTDTIDACVTLIKQEVPQNGAMANVSTLVKIPTFAALNSHPSRTESTSTRMANVNSFHAQLVNNAAQMMLIHMNAKHAVELKSHAEDSVLMLQSVVMMLMTLSAKTKMDRMFAKSNAAKVTKSTTHYSELVNAQIQLINSAQIPTDAKNAVVIWLHVPMDNA